jgi:hypothetical protein
LTGKRTAVSPARISIVRDPADRLADDRAVRWAIGQLRAAIEAKGASVELLHAAPENGRAAASIVVAGPDSPLAQDILRGSGISFQAMPEALGLVPSGSSGTPILLACGADVRGLVSAVLEFADRVEHGADAVQAVRLDGAVIERPVNAVRSVARCFASEVHDKPWFQDRNFWRRYLSMIVAQRFNRINLMVGLGYNFPWHVTDAYLHFAYPFLVDVPGYRVRVPQLADGERERNLDMLRFASEEAVARGLDFQLGLWTHAYEWFDSPEAQHTVEGLTPDLHAGYCRDAIQMVLEACPAIGGLTLRAHGESGVPERSWDFWRIVLDGAVRTGRRIGIDLHAKGLDELTLEIALATGLPITVSPKFSAEHMGLPYHQSALRELDRVPTERDGAREGKARFMAVSEGSRLFTRYSYGDFLRQDRSYDVVFRIWPGTQRVLLWGDPAMAAGFGRHAGLAGSQGLEWCEPQSLKGREGTGVPGPRDGYADASLSCSDDWAKHAYTYRLFGRLLYNPSTAPEAWRRPLRSAFGTAEPVEAALASASRILPLVTTAHHPSASNNYYWPEVYTDIGIVGRNGSVETHYYDTPIPKRFGTVGPLDPETFLGVEEFVREVIAGRRSGRYSPLEVAEWLERLSGDARKHLAEMERELPDPTRAEARRVIADVGIQEALGRFFAGKLRAAFHYELFARTGSSEVLQQGLEAYRRARGALAEAADRAAGVYVRDLTYGPQPWLRGTWSDRLPAIDRDIDVLAAVARAPREQQENEAWRLLDLARRERPSFDAFHEPPRSFRRGEPVVLSLRLGSADSPPVASVELRYRHLDQSEAYSATRMSFGGGRYVATIAAEASDSPFPLQYFFVIRDTAGSACLHPGLGADLSGQPYYVVCSRARSGP